MDVVFSANHLPLLTNREGLVNQPLRKTMKSSSCFRFNFSCLGSAIVALSILASSRPVDAQTRGFPTVLSERTLAVGTILQHWQAIQDELRATAGPKRRPEFEFRMFARELPDNNLEKFSAEKLPDRIILVIGGLQSSIEPAERFATALSGALHDPLDTRMAVFGYPNDGSISESADVLHEMLADLNRQSPKTKVSIVAHSMGSLVARHAIEPIAPETRCQLPCVDQLVMICPPNHGSVLAQYADALELHDGLSKIKSNSLTLTQLCESLVNDGLGEACEQLVPNSPFLCKLNGRKRADGVRYSTFAGTGGPITPLVRFASAVAIKETQERTRINRLPNARDALERADELLLSDEFAKGLGDGAVSLRSASLQGVNEFVTVPINHGEWAQVDQPQVQQLIQSIADQLCRTPKPAELRTHQRAKF